MNLNFTPVDLGIPQWKKTSWDTLQQGYVWAHHVLPYPTVLFYSTILSALPFPPTTCYHGRLGIFPPKLRRESTTTFPPPSSSSMDRIMLTGKRNMSIPLNRMGLAQFIQRRKTGWPPPYRGWLNICKYLPHSIVFTNIDACILFSRPEIDVSVEPS